MNDLLERVQERQFRFNVQKILPFLVNANEGAIKDVLEDHARYYQFLPCLIDEIKPKQIVELGGAMGVACLCMLTGSTYKDFELWSISLQEHGLEYDYIVNDFNNLHMVIGDDLDLGNWPRKLDLSQTDLWFFDSLHTPEQLRAELNLYKQFFKKGAVVLIDDIHSFDLDPVWEEFTKGVYGDVEAVDVSYLHTTGFGIGIVQ